MIRKILTAKIPLAAVIILLLMMIVGFGVFTFLSDRNINYTLFMGNVTPSPAELEFGPMPALGDFDFFNNVKNSLLDNEADFIEANLSDMVIRTYIGGVMEHEAPILTKGREGSWWETPAGIYKIETMEKSHFSSFGHVFQPWSMSFQGNFFIHGWPYYPDGTAVESTYSGGCIRLADDAAEDIFKLAHTGMPVIVFEKDFASDGFVHHSKGPQISADAYLVADLMNNYVFLEKNRAEELPVASITKIMTALVASEFINLEKEISVPEEALIKTSKPRLTKEKKISAYDLLFPLLLESSNEAAETFAIHTGRNWFISLMNKKALSVGMSQSSFADPSGISENNISNCVDLFNLSKYLYNNRSFILKISSGNLKNSVYGEPVFKDLGNFNLFGEDPSFVGGKIGKTTAANETFLSVFNLHLSETDRPIAIILLGSDDVGSDTRNIINWLSSNY
jgi:D-alanyl-D-alanine carboxypeptidase